jgi:BASS family bile acid:Na+ symporter
VEANIITAIFLPIALGIIMLGMGLALTPDHFRRILTAPKVVITGLVMQIGVLPVLAWLIAIVTQLPPELAVGLMVVAACPGGATSNLISHLAKADGALSITLTAFSSCIIVFTIPFVINLGGSYFMGEAKPINLPVLQTIGQIFLVTILPVCIGMFLKSRFPTMAQRSQQPVKVLSAIFLTILVVGAMVRERDNLLDFFAQVGLATVGLNLGAMAIGFTTARLMRLATDQARTIGIEVGIQNGTLGIAIATAPSLLANPTMAIPSAIYSLVMFASGGALVFWSLSRSNPTPSTAV